MERYESYKDSGVKWLGEIPSHWTVMKNKFIFKESEETNVELKYQLLSFSKSKGIIPFSDLNSKEYSATDLKKYKVIHKGQLLENRLQAWNGMFACSDIEGCVSPDYSVFELIRTNFDIKYLSYVFTTPLYIEQWANASKGIGAGFNRLYTPQFNNIYAITPPKSEQTAIANYLDSVTSKIDEAISQQQRMIDLLNERKQIVIQNAVTKGLDPNAKMKDSGVEWIGEIPENWEVRPLKYIKAKEKNAFVDGPFGSNLKSEHYVENGDVYVIESGMITTGTFVAVSIKTIKTSHFNTIARSECREKDIIIAKIGAKFGMSAELPKLNKRSVLSGNSIKLTINQSIYCNQLFIWYMMSAKMSGGFIGLYQETAQPALSLSSLSNILIPIPPKHLQSTIVEITKNKIEKIDSSISQCNKMISLLQERKQIIINDVVTGKVKVV